MTRNSRKIISFLVNVCVLVTMMSRLSVAQENLPNRLSILPGDLAPRSQQDGELNTADVIMMQKIISDEIDVTNNELVNADVAPLGEPDGSIDSADLLVLLRASLGKVDIPSRVPDRADLNRIRIVWSSDSQHFYVHGSVGAAPGGYGVVVELEYQDGVEEYHAKAWGDGSFIINDVDGSATRISVTVYGNGLKSETVSRVLGGKADEYHRYEIMQTWNALMDAFESEEMGVAAEQFHEDVRDHYTSIMEKIGPEISNIPDALSHMSAISHEYYYAEYIVKQDTPNGDVLRKVGFLTDQSGSWKVVSF